jgi:hypothetical protein
VDPSVDDVFDHTYAVLPEELRRQKEQHIAFLKESEEN